MWQRGVGVEARIVYGIDGIDSIGEYLFFHTVEVATDHQCFEFTIQLIGQRATFVSSSRLTSAMMPSSISQYTIRLFIIVSFLVHSTRALTNRVVGDQFFDKVFDFVVGSRESFAFLCLEYNVLYGFYFGGRTGKTYLIEVGIDIVYTPFVKVEGRTLFIEFQAFFAQSLFFARCLGVFVTLYELRVARTAFIGRTVDRDDCGQGNYDGFYPAFETTFHGGFPVFYAQNLLGIGDLGIPNFSAI